MDGDLSLFQLSLLFGGAVIAIFAINQFSRPSFEASKELERLIRFLDARDFRNRRVVWRAYAAYVAILLLIYGLICSYFTLPMLQAIGVIVPEGATSARSPVVPLIVSLAMVGLAPAIKPLQQFEEKIRRLAHYFSGIPARLVQGCRELQKLSLGLPRNGAGMLIPDIDWKRLRHYRRYGELLLEDPDDFAEDMAKIVAYRSWVLKHALCSTGAESRPGIERNDVDLEARIGRLIQNLDILSRFRQGEEPTPAAEQSREAWQALAGEADEICADVCAMLMLRVEHGLISPNRILAEVERADREEAAQAEERLSAFIAGAGQWVDHCALVSSLWVRATLVALPVAFFWGAFVGPRETGRQAGQVALELGTTYVVTAAMIYSLGIFVALSLHDRALRASEPGRRWPGIATSHWTVSMGPAAKILLSAWGAAALGVVALSVAQTSVRFGFRLPEETSYGALMLGALYSEGPRTLLGAVLGLGIVALIDVMKEVPVRPRARWTVLIVTVGALMVLSPTLQALALQYRDVHNYGECVERIERERLDLGVDFCEQFRFVKWRELISREAEALALVSLRVGLIGSLVMFVCHATLAAGAQGPGEAARRGGAMWRRRATAGD